MKADQSCPTLCDPMDCMQHTRLLCPWNSPGKYTGVVYHFLLQGIFPAQELNPGLPPCRQILYDLSHQGREEAKRRGKFMFNFSCHVTQCAFDFTEPIQILEPSILYSKSTDLLYNLKRITYICGCHFSKCYIRGFSWWCSV